MKPRNASSLQKAIDELSTSWLGQNGVIAIYEDVRDSETVIVLLVTTAHHPERFPASSHGYRVVIEQGVQFAAQKTTNIIGVLADAGRSRKAC